MRCIFAPPHHCVVPSPYEQGESAVRMVAVLCALYSVLCALYSVL